MQATPLMARERSQIASCAASDKPQQWWQQICSTNLRRAVPVQWRPERRRFGRLPQQGRHADRSRGLRTRRHRTRPSPGQCSRPSCRVSRRHTLRGGGSIATMLNMVGGTL
eukprot:5438376-Pleurochrysis_carterae.AAC.1